MLRREASAWLARLEGGRSPEIEQRFRQWHEAHPAHAEAFERVRRSYRSAGLLRHSGLARDRSLPARVSPLPQPRWALAGAIALAVLVPVAILLAGKGLTPAGPRNTVLLASAVGEIREVTLEDGSRVTLDTSTAVEVGFGRSERHAVVREGRARFEIAADSRPFVIEAGRATVRAVRAVLDVEAEGEHAQIEVYSGSATAGLAPGPQPPSTVAIDAGEGLSTARGPGEYRLTIDRSAWTRGMLQFDGTPLSEAAALANRYSANMIVVAPAIGQLRVTGAFKAGDLAGLARSLAEAFDLRLERTPSGDFHLTPRPDSLSNKKNGG